MTEPVAYSVAEALADAFRRHGVRRLFGVPGGGSSLDVIRACAARGIPFVLARSENAAVMMAGATAELSGGFGVALTTKGPGLANAANGVAYASLDRAPVLVLTDGFTPALMGYATHQVFDGRAMLGPVVKGHSRLEGADPAGELEGLIRLATAAPGGPVHLELTGAAVRRGCAPFAAAAAAGPGAAAGPPDAVVAALARARRPLIVAGLEARGASAPLAALQGVLGCPVLCSYKAKGTLPDGDPASVGLFTGGAAEAECVAAADLLLLVGLDPVELVLQPWAFAPPVAEVATWDYPVRYVTPVARHVGPIGPALRALAAGLTPRGPGWTRAEIAGHKAAMRERLAYGGRGPGLSPVDVVLAAADVLGPGDPRITVDAGAHMFSAMAFWPCGGAADVLISNGLATMAFALPAAIAASLHDPGRAVVAFTGDGGLMMALGELATAAQAGARIRVVVFNDAALSLIAIKQEQRGLPAEGVSGPHMDFAAVARGLGLVAWSADTPKALRGALLAARDVDGPALIDVRVDPGFYGEQLRAMRG